MRFWKGLFGNKRADDPRASPKDEELQCDICSKKTWRQKGYFLTTTEVTTNSHFWQFQRNILLAMPEEVAGGMLTTMIKDFASNRTPWLVCERCSSMFDFDRKIARDSAIRNTAPPNSGPADLNVVRNAAQRAMLMSD